jgi:predicted HicB family RNase H-like nuclease
MEEQHKFMLRLPKPLHSKLVQESGEQTVKRKERVSVNQVIIEILEAYFEKRTAKRG